MVGRRQIVNGKPVQEPEQSAMSIRVLSSSLSVLSSQHPKASIERHSWVCPPSGLVKLNVDAFFDWGSPSGSMGAVIRDDKGHFIAAAGQHIALMRMWQKPWLCVSDWNLL